MLELKEIVCPDCNKRGLIKRLISSKRNYKFGKKSTPIFTPKKVKYWCTNINQTFKDGKITEHICKFKYHFDLRKQKDYLGEVN